MQLAGLGAAARRTVRLSTHDALVVDISCITVLEELTV